jgi:hypothetical protein
MNIKYKMKVHMTWAAWYLIIYASAMFLLYYVLIKTSVINNSTGSLSYRIWGLIIFQFAVTMRFKENFDFFLTLSNTRNEIFQSLMGVALIFSAFFSGLIVLERVIVDHLNNIFGLHTVKDFFHYLAPYATDNHFLQFIFFLILCICCSSFGLLMGSLFYRFGKKFMVAFWLIFSAIPTVIFPLFLWILHLRNHLSGSVKAMGEFFRTFDVTAGSGVLFILTIIFSIAAWLNIQRLPQK